MDGYSNKRGIQYMDIFKSGNRQKKYRTKVLDQFVSYLMTDDERAEFYGLPSGCRIRENAKIYSRENFECGEDVWIGEGAKLDATSGLTIGNNTSIGLNVYIWSHTTYLTNLLYENQPGGDLISQEETTIGSGVFIGGPSVIYPGVEIGDQSMVLPMSVVDKDVPTRKVAGGAPASIIEDIDEEFIRKKLKEHTNWEGELIETAVEKFREGKNESLS